MPTEKYNLLVPRNIARLIEERGLKQSAVAEWAGYTKQQLSDMLNGRRIIRPCDVMAISMALDIDVGDLFVETGEGQPESA